jgi:hypothetical protein
MDHILRRQPRAASARVNSRLLLRALYLIGNEPRRSQRDIALEIGVDESTLRRSLTHAREVYGVVIRWSSIDGFAIEDWGVFKPLDAMTRGKIFHEQAQ